MLRIWLCLAAVALNARVGLAAEQAAGTPIAMQWVEGDLGGITRILSPDGKQTIGVVEYHQQRQGDRLKAVRLARFADGSSDEDRAEARVGKTLEGLRGRTILRDTKGKAVVDFTIDVAGGRVKGFYTDDGKREEYDEQIALPPGTYWGPLVMIVARNFAANATGDRLIFHTVVATPKPRAIDMELVREGSAAVTRSGFKFNASHFTMKPSVFWLVDPIIQRLAPATHFYLGDGPPPFMVRFQGPRNYTGQEIRIE